MPKIIQLSPQLIAKIAAGEVIERPSYAVKELIDNAIDAKTTEIAIHLEQAGLKKIQVIDNGTGMDKKDLEESIKPHTTSKLKPDDTLIGIKTLGFRGEALASLGAVSHLIIKSRTAKEPVGYVVEVKNGHFEGVSIIGTPIGTNVTAINLFSSVPARKKFLKSPQTELRHSIDVISSFALAYPKIKFVLTHNKKTILDFPKNQTQKERLEKILGNITSYFLPVSFDDSYVKVEGFIAKPQINSSGQSKQYIFVNSRRVQDKLISTAVKQAFGTMLEPTLYPVFVLFIDVPKETIDVNVHPRKEQVAFVNNKAIFETVTTITQKVLSDNNLSFQKKLYGKLGKDTTTSFAGNLLKEEVLQHESLVSDTTSPFIQLHNVYIVTQSKHGIIFVDQHAAHERILFEKLLKEFKSQQKKTSSFQLIKPKLLDLSKTEQQLLEEYKDFFTTLGFIFINKRNQVALSHIPKLFHDRNPEHLLKNMLDNLQEDIPLQAVDSVTLEMISYLACRAAVKLGDKLSVDQIKNLLEELEVAPNNATCPHGRPTKIVFPLKNISRLFKRGM